MYEQQKTAISDNFADVYELWDLVQKHYFPGIKDWFNEEIVGELLNDGLTTTFEDYPSTIQMFVDYIPGDDGDDVTPPLPSELNWAGIAADFEFPIIDELKNNAEIKAIQHILTKEYDDYGADWVERQDVEEYAPANCC